MSSSFFFNDTATTEIYTLSLHDALPISNRHRRPPAGVSEERAERRGQTLAVERRIEDHLRRARSEEHTSELQSHSDLVCRLLLEKKKKKSNIIDSRQCDMTTEQSEWHTK